MRKGDSKWQQETFGLWIQESSICITIVVLLLPNSYREMFVMQTLHQVYICVCGVLHCLKWGNLILKIPLLWLFQTAEASYNLQIWSTFLHRTRTVVFVPNHLHRRFIMGSLNVQPEQEGWLQQAIVHVSLYISAPDCCFNTDKKLWTCLFK